GAPIQQPYSGIAPVQAPQVPGITQMGGQSGPNVQEQAGGPSFDALVKLTEQQKGGAKLSRDELDMLATRYKDHAITIPMFNRKASQAAVQANNDAFDRGYDEYLQNYLPVEGTVAPEDAEGRGLFGTAAELGGALVSGAVDVVGGAANLADYGVR